MQQLYATIKVNLYSNNYLRLIFMNKLKEKFKTSKSIEIIANYSKKRNGEGITGPIDLIIPIYLSKENGIYIKDQFLMLPQLFDAMCKYCVKSQYSEYQDTEWFTIKDFLSTQPRERMISIKIKRVQVGIYDSPLRQAVLARGALLLLAEEHPYREQFLQI